MRLRLALYSIMTRRLSGIVAVETMQFYMGFIGTALMAPFAIWAWVQPDTHLGHGGAWSALACWAGPVTSC